MSASLTYRVPSTLHTTAYVSPSSLVGSLEIPTAPSVIKIHPSVAASLLADPYTTSRMELAIINHNSILTSWYANRTLNGLPTRCDVSTPEVWDAFNEVMDPAYRQLDAILKPRGLSAYSDDDGFIELIADYNF